MGKLIAGEWAQDEMDIRKRESKFLRPDSQFRNWITPDAPFPETQRARADGFDVCCPLVYGQRGLDL